MNWFKNLFGNKRSASAPKSQAIAAAATSPATVDEMRRKYASLAKPAVHIRPADTSDFSQLGGEPLLPESIAWPEWNGNPQSFLAQIDLTEIHAALPSFLPPGGLLYFFYDQEQSIWGFDPKDRGGWQVFYFNGDRATLKPRPAPAGLEEHAKFKRKPVKFQRIDTLPDSQRLRESGFEWKRDGDAYFKLCSEPFENQTIHQTLGYPRPIQGDDMELECQLASNGLYVGNAEGYNDPRRAALESGSKDWKLLLQLDTDDDTGWMWGDVGTLYFWIREQDAVRADFSKVWMVFQCS